MTIIPQASRNQHFWKFSNPVLLNHQSDLIKWITKVSYWLETCSIITEVHWQIPGNSCPQGVHNTSRNSTNYTQNKTKTKFNRSDYKKKAGVETNQKLQQQPLIPNPFQVLISEWVAICKSPIIILLTVHSKCAFSMFHWWISAMKHMSCLCLWHYWDLCANTVPGKDSGMLNGILGLHVILFVFILRGTDLLGSAGRCCCHLCLLGSLLHL